MHLNAHLYSVLVLALPVFSSPVGQGEIHEEKACSQNGALQCLLPPNGSPSDGIDPAEFCNDLMSDPDSSSNIPRDLSTTTTTTTNSLPEVKRALESKRSGCLSSFVSTEIDKACACLGRHRRPACGTNLIDNPSFEASFYAWTVGTEYPTKKYERAHVVDGGHYSHASFEVEAPAGNSNTYILHQIKGMRIGRVYTFSFDYLYLTPEVPQTSIKCSLDGHEWSSPTNGTSPNVWHNGPVGGASFRPEHKDGMLSHPLPQNPDLPYSNAKLGVPFSATGEQDDSA
ncbi:hypothetical protein JHW43_003663 [Diplocarpon mali]|nr:hypothetical protein JHW43_003663 [Diplocarpon mali]